MTPTQKVLFDGKEKASQLLRDHIDTWANGTPDEMRVGFEVILNNFNSSNREYYEHHQNVQWLISVHGLTNDQAEDFLDWRGGGA